MLNSFLGIFKAFWVFLKWPLIIAFAVVILFMFLVVCHYLKLMLIDKMRPITGVHYKVKKVNIFKRLFYDAPKRYARDLMERDPEWFRHQGCVIYTGRQGSGKTSALVRDTLLIQKEYPKCKVLSNLNYKYQDEVLDDWTKLIDYQNPNGKDRGILIQMDETQNWFSSKQSKDFPPEMLQVITQNRKNRRIIFGTAQNFYMLAKDIRSQCTEIRSCNTLAGCITIVHRQIPIINKDGEVEKMKHKGFYFFVHNEELRNAYDTYKVIESLRKSGFKENVSNDQIVNIYSVPEKKKAFRK